MAVEAECGVPVTNGLGISNNAKEVAGEIKVYKRRWLILALYWFIVTACMMQFMTYSIIADVLVTFYEITYPIAGWSSMICMITYLVFVIPGSYILDAFGVRTCAIISMVFTCAGAWIKVGSVDPSRFWVLILGQGVTGAIQSIAGALSIKIAAVWFPEREVSTANAIGLVGIQVGVIAGMFLPPLIVHQGAVEEMEKCLYIMAYVTAGFSTLVLALVIFFLPDTPPNVPSYAQYNATKDERSALDYWHTLKKILSNLSFVFLMLSMCLIFGVMYPMMININQLMLAHHSDAAQDVGYILTTGTLIGLLGTFGVGVILDKFHAFKITYISMSILCPITLILFIELIPYSLYISYVTSIGSGITCAALSTVAMELGVELTYPEPQSMSATIVGAFAQTAGIGFTYAHSALLADVSEFWANMMLYIFMGVGILLMFGIRYDLKRLCVENELKASGKLGTI